MAIARWAISKFSRTSPSGSYLFRGCTKKRDMKEKFSDGPNVRKTSLGGLPSLHNPTGMLPQSLGHKITAKMVIKPAKNLIGS